MIWTIFALFVAVFLVGLVAVIRWSTDGFSGTWDET